MDKLIVEGLIKRILQEVTGVTAVSVCSLGDEWSVNIGGRLYSFTCEVLASEGKHQHQKETQ